MSTQVFRKTEAGREELKVRRVGLPVATRQVLIQVNGIDPVNALMAKGLAEVRSHLATLIELRLIEPVREAARDERPGSAQDSGRELVRAPVQEAMKHAVPPPAPAEPGHPRSAQPLEVRIASRAPRDAAGARAHEEVSLVPLQRQLLATLRPHFGPDAADVAQAALAAGSTDEFHRALDAIESKLAIYMGRKAAAQELLALREPG